MRIKNVLAVVLFGSVVLSGCAVNKNLWPASTLETEAFYSPTNNSINIMLGLLGDDFYRKDMSKEQLYASIGTMIGHEISHAFDPSGSHFDKNGDMKDWWTKEDMAAYSYL